MSSTYTLFVGDLSVFVTVDDLRSMFSKFGEIATLRIKKDSTTGKNLSYGFIEFISQNAVVEAIKEMNGAILCGRPLRLRWGLGRGEPDSSKECTDTTALYVTFNNFNTAVIVTEQTIREVFTPFGHVVDATVKMSGIDVARKINRGYGFIHFAATSEGKQAALIALAEMHLKQVGSVQYDCKLSKSFKMKLDQAKIMPEKVDNAVFQRDCEDCLTDDETETFYDVNSSSSDSMMDLNSAANIAAPMMSLMHPNAIVYPTLHHPYPQLAVQTTYGNGDLSAMTSPPLSPNGSNTTAASSNHHLSWAVSVSPPPSPTDANVGYGAHPTSGMMTVPSVAPTYYYVPCNNNATNMAQVPMMRQPMLVYPASATVGGHQQWGYYPPLPQQQNCVPAAYYYGTTTTAAYAYPMQQHCTNYYYYQQSQQQLQQHPYYVPHNHPLNYSPVHNTVSNV